LAQRIWQSCFSNQRCVEIQPNCGLLHDTFAGLWADMKDVHDLLKQKIAEDAKRWKSIYEGVNGQIHDLSMHKAELQATLAEAASTRAAQVQQQSRKQVEASAVEERITATHAECKATIRSILFSEMCAPVKVRNALLVSNRKDVQPEDIVDCEVSDWIPGECSVPCDNSMQGGKMTLTREVMVAPSRWGVDCPALSLTIPCNRVKCPIDCKVSQWSGWSACTKECGGGVQSRTRAIMRKPQFGGDECMTNQETRACHTDSCDRDCRLGSWSPFSACSKACSTGYQERRKKVLVKPHGNGRCLREDDHRRYQQIPCNTQACVGDEVCLQQADLILAIDGSGSLTAEGFEVFKTFASKLVLRLRSSAYGREAMRVAVVQFGNGRLDNKRVVSDAKIIALSSGDMQKVAEKIKGMKWQRGFTNIAQAMLKAQFMLRSRSRPSATSTVLLLTDGRPTFKLQASSAVERLRKIARLLIVQVQAHRKEESARLLKAYASQPWQTNYIHIPGKKALKGAYDQYATQVVTQLCPRAESPSGTAARDDQRGFRKSREGVNCGPSASKAAKESLNDCYIMAATAPGGWNSFAYGAGHCLVYANPCKTFQRNSSYDVYMPVTSGVKAGQVIVGSDDGWMDLIKR